MHKKKERDMIVKVTNESCAAGSTGRPVTEPGLRHCLDGVVRPFTVYGIMQASRKNIRCIWIVLSWMYLFSLATKRWHRWTPQGYPG